MQSADRASPRNLSMRSIYLVRLLYFCSMKMQTLLRDCLARMLDLRVRLMRLSHIHGFGVQSPSAYRRIRYVFCQPLPYYSYTDIKQMMRSETILRHKLGKLYFRMANESQADAWNIWGMEGAELMARCVRLGCKRSVIHTDDITALPSSLPATHNIVMLTDCQTLDESRLSQVLDLLNPYSQLILEGIHRDRKSRQLWQRIQSDDRTGISFDLYHCGVISGDTRPYKQHYIVHF